MAGVSSDWRVASCCRGCGVLLDWAHSVASSEKCGVRTKWFTSPFFLQKETVP